MTDRVASAAADIPYTTEPEKYADAPPLLDNFDDLDHRSLVSDHVSDHGLMIDVVLSHVLVRMMRHMCRQMRCSGEECAVL